MFHFNSTLIPLCPRWRHVVRVCAVVSLAFGLLPLAWAAQPSSTLPTGGQVAAGNATIGHSGNTMTINQTSQRAVLNWNTFNLGSNATVNFKQPNSQAVILNRVTSATPSQIDGAVNANGRVIISNTNGVTFGKGAEINAGAVVATTMNQSDAEFMSGSNTFTGNGTGKVVNKGKINITDPNGYVALLAPEVRNQGVILATVSPNNAVVVGAAEKLTLNFKDTNLIGITVEKAAVNALIENKRAIEVAGGTIVIAAGSANQLIRSVIQNTGRISANSMTSNGGVVELIAGTVNNNGSISANAQGVGHGGTVRVLADNVNLGTKSDIQANATIQGNGGSIQIWANQNALIAGQLSATGGVISGNGGSIDTSAKHSVTFDPNLKVDTSAKNGRFGHWKIDPLELTIDTNAAILISAALLNTNVTLDATGSSCLGGLANCATSTLPLVNFLAGANIYSDNAVTTLRVLATGGTVNVHSNIDAGQVYIEAANISVKGNIGSTGGASSLIVLLGAQINIFGGLGSNGQSTIGSSSASILGSNRRRRMAESALDVDNTPYTTIGGSVLVLSSGDIFIDKNAALTANGLSGGLVSVVSQHGKVTMGGIADALGTFGKGGQILLSGQTATLVNGALMSADGKQEGGTLKIGNDATNGKLPFSVNTHIDAKSVLSASQASGNTTSGSGGYIETSGQTLVMLGAINVGRGGMWLIDPNDMLINSALAGTISSALSGGSDVTVTSTGCSGAVCSPSEGNGNILISSPISASGTGSLTLTPGGGSIYISANVTTGGAQTYNGNIVLSGGITLTTTNRDITINGSISTGYFQILQLSDSGATVSINGGNASTSVSGLTGSAGTYTYTPGAAFTNVNYLLVGGGGGGGSNWGGGGGGAGGVLTGTTSGSSWNISIGAGGLGATAGNGSSGGSSSAFGVTAFGGGGGGAGGSAGLSGASGGGAGGISANAGGAATQGYSGGTSLANTGGSGGGGSGGAGSAGGTQSAGGSGGLGTTNNISGNSVIYAAGGGGGAGDTGTFAGGNTGVSGVPGVGGSSGAGGGGGTCNFGCNAPGANGATPGSGGGGGSTNGGTGGAGGSGLAILSGTMSASGSLTIASGTGKVDLSGATVNLSSLEIKSSSTASTISAAVVGSTALTLTAPLTTGILTLSGNNTYTGVTTVNTGYLSISAPSNINGGVGGLTLAGGGLRTSADITLNPVLTLAALKTSVLYAAGSATLTINGNITGAGNLLIANGATGTVVLGGTNDFTGSTTIYGKLTLANSNALSTSALNIGSPGLLDVAGYSISNPITVNLSGARIRSSAAGGALTGGITLAANSITLSAASGASLTVGTNAISGTGTTALTIGSGTDTGSVVLSAANTYTGTTTIFAGTLKADNAAALGPTTGAGAVSITSGAVLDLNGQSLTNSGTLTLRGTGIGSGGALINSSSAVSVFKWFETDGLIS
jgi:filamentous hemagglutinin family protein